MAWQILNEETVTYVPGVGLNTKRIVPVFPERAVVRAGINVNGFGWNLFRQSNPPQTRCSSDSFDIRQLQHVVKGIIVVGYPDRVTIQGGALGITRAHRATGNIGSNKAQLAHGPICGGD
jgi:hypothetical protein